jgi:hypothetical protein
MPRANEYTFVEHWSVPGHSPTEVYGVLSNSSLLPDWWKGVYQKVEPFDGEGARVGARTKVRARGFLPYTLSFVLTTTAFEPGRLVETRAEGDFDGTWRAEIREEGDGTRVDITWTTSVNKPLVRFLSPVLKPIFRKNHDWTTVKGEQGLKSYLVAQRKRLNSVT